MLVLFCLWKREWMVKKLQGPRGNRSLRPRAWLIGPSFSRLQFFQRIVLILSFILPFPSPAFPNSALGLDGQWNRIPPTLRNDREYMDRFHPDQAGKRLADWDLIGRSWLDDENDSLIQWLKRFSFLCLQRRSRPEIKCWESSRWPTPWWQGKEMDSLTGSSVC